MTKTIERDQIRYSKFSVDDIGKLFYWKGGLFRAISSESADDVKNMFDCGMINELVSKGLFPRSHITDYALEGYEMIVEHEKVDMVTYPYEWSFSMLKDAAITILKVNEIAGKYSYQTKDGHGFNVVFRCGYPQFVDLGSFVRVKADFKGWQAYGEFLRFCYYPLQMWAEGNGFVARRMLFGDEFMSHASFLLYKSPIWRLLGYGCASKASDVYYKFRNISSVERSKILLRNPFGLGRVIAYLKDRQWLPLQRVKFPVLIKKIERIKRKKASTLWSGYHDRFYGTQEVKSTPRFDRVIKAIKDIEVDSVLEVAGNQGAFSMLLSERTGIKDILCSDNNEDAVDKLYMRIKEKACRITPVLLNFISPIITTYTKPSKERLKCDLVVAMAVTHHLILTNKISIDCILDAVVGYSKKYVLIEFMPLGLFNGKNRPEVPDWYNVDWFRRHFERYFDIIIEEKLEENRIVFMGETKNSKRGT